MSIQSLVTVLSMPHASSRHSESVLRVIAECANARLPLQGALRERCGGAGGMIADRLDAGDSIAAAVSGVIPEELRLALLGPRPPLEQTALFVAESLRLRREARTALIAHLAHPIMTLLGVAAVITLTLVIGRFGIAMHWAIAACAVAASCVVVIGVSCHPRWAKHMPGVAAHAYHAKQADRYARAALAARWRLPEHDLERLLGPDLSALGPVLALPNADQYCQRLATYHHDRASRSLKSLARWLAYGLAVMGGCLILAAAIPTLAAAVDLMIELGTIPEL